MESAVELLAAFVTFNEKLGHWIKDDSKVGIGFLDAGQVRAAARAYRPDMTELEAIAALAPFAEEGKHVQERARDWPWSTSGLTYGHFLRALEVVREYHQNA